MSHICPHCGEEIEVEIGVPSPPQGRNWRRLAMLAALAVLAAGGLCMVILLMR